MLLSTLQIVFTITCTDVAAVKNSLLDALCQLQTQFQMKCTEHYVLLAFGISHSVKHKITTKKSLLQLSLFSAGGTQYD